MKMLKHAFTFNIFTVISILSFGMGPTSVQAQTSGDVTKEIEAEVMITRGVIDNLLDEINERQRNTEFKTRDYLEQTEEFNSRLTNALKSFEETLEKDVLVPAGEMVAQYKQISQSTVFSPSQKEIVLRERKEFFRNQFETVLTPRYQKALKELYRVTPMPEFEAQNLQTKKIFTSKKKVNHKVKVKVFKDQENKQEISITFQQNSQAKGLFLFIFGEWLYLNAHIICNNDKPCSPSNRVYPISPLYSSYYDKRNNEIITEVNTQLVLEEGHQFFIDVSDLYGKVIYPFIKGRCKSSLCVGLRSGDYVTLLKKINGLIDRDIDFPNVGTIKGYGREVDNLVEVITRADYPEKLPFEI